MTTPDRPLGAGRSHISLILATRDDPYASDLTAFMSDFPGGISVDAVVSDLIAVPGSIKSTPCVVLVDQQLTGADWGQSAAEIYRAGAARVFLLQTDLGAGTAVPTNVEPVFKYAMGGSLVERIRSVPFAAERTEPTPPVPAGSSDRRVLALYSPRGGAGCSTLAANMAYLYATKGKRVALVDFARYGSQHVILRQPQRGQGLSSLVTLLSQQPGATGSERVATYLQQALQRVQYGSLSFHLLPAAQPGRMDQISATHVKTICEHLISAGFNVVLVDLSQEMSERVRGALAAADRVVIPVLPEIVSVWHALQIRDMLGAGLGVHPVYVINRMRSKSGFDPGEFARLGGAPLLGTVADDSREMQRDLASGRLTAMRNRSLFTASVRRLAHALYPVFEASELSRGRWPWSRG